MSQRSTSIRDVIQARAGSLCLIGILSATYLHTTTFMSQFFYHSILLGGVAALAIDAGVVSMSLYKDKIISKGDLGWMVRTVTVIVLLSSGIANMSEGFKSAYGQALSLSTFQSTDIFTIMQWLAGTIVFPILAYIMADTIAERHMQSRMGKQSHADPEVVEKVTYVETPGPSIKEIGDAARKEKAANRRFALLKVIKDNPECTIRELQSLLNENYPEHAVDSHSTIDNDLKILKTQGLLAGNGKVESLV